MCPELVSALCAVLGGRLEGCDVQHVLRLLIELAYPTNPSHCELSCISPSHLGDSCDFGSNVVGYKQGRPGDDWGMPAVANLLTTSYPC